VAIGLTGLPEGPERSVRLDQTPAHASNCLGRLSRTQPGRPRRRPSGLSAVGPDACERPPTLTVSAIRVARDRNVRICLSCRFRAGRPRGCGDDCLLEDSSGLDALVDGPQWPGARGADQAASSVIRPRQGLSFPTAAPVGSNEVGDQPVRVLEASERADRGGRREIERHHITVDHLRTWRVPGPSD
jgi:hypothetical protein